MDLELEQNIRFSDSETANKTSRIESTSVADMINVSAYTDEVIKDIYGCVNQDGMKN